MSCKRCEEAQESGQSKYYIRIGSGNVELSGCHWHVKALMSMISIANLTMLDAEQSMAEKLGSDE